MGVPKGTPIVYYIVVILLCFFFFFWNNEVEDHCNDEYYSDAVLGKDCLNDLWEDGEHLCCLCEAKADAERE